MVVTTVVTVAVVTVVATTVVTVVVVTVVATTVVTVVEASGGQMESL